MLAGLAALGGCSDNDAIISTDPPTAVFAPATSTAQCTAPASACVLAAGDVSTDTGSTVFTAVPNAGVTGSSVTAPSQGGCAYGTSADGGAGTTINANYFCGIFGGHQHRLRGGLQGSGRHGDGHVHRGAR